MKDYIARMSEHFSKKAIEPAESSNEEPDFFMHKYENGKRAYNSFVCNRCPTIVRKDKMKKAGVWKCYNCVATPSSVLRDKNGHRLVSSII